MQKYEPNQGERADDRKVSFFVPDDNIHGWKPSDEPIERKANLLSYIENARRQAQERFEPDIEGLNLGRVDDFFASTGLRESPTLVIDKSREPELRRFLAENAGTNNIPEAAGFYMPIYDMSFVFRDRDIEDVSGPEYTESNIIHEKAHGSSAYTDITATADESTVGIDASRFGQRPSTLVSKANNDFGSFLEEGFCEAVRAKYVIDALKRPHGLTGQPFDIATMRDNSGGFDVPMPTKFMYKVPNGPDTFPYPTAFAGAALDLMMLHDPYLFAAMVKARKSVDGLREVAVRINMIKPGLYKELRDDYNESGEYSRGLKHVADIMKNAGNEQ